VALDTEKDIIEVKCGYKAGSFRIISLESNFGIFLVEVLNI